MEEIFSVKGTNLTIKIPAELDHHNSEILKVRADQIIQRKKSAALHWILEKRGLWTAPASA